MRHEPGANASGGERLERLSSDDFTASAGAILLSGVIANAQGHFEQARRHLEKFLTLEPDHGGTPVTLSSFRGEKPVALIFGSYT